MLHDQDNQDKKLITLKTKKAFKMKGKSFFIIFKGLLLKQIKLTFLEGKTPTFKYLSNIWRVLKMFVIDCQILLLLTWSDN